VNQIDDLIKGVKEQVIDVNLMFLHEKKKAPLVCEPVDINTKR